MQTFKMAALSPIQVAAMDKLPIDKQEEIKNNFGQPLTLSKAYYILRDATQNFTSTASDAARKLDDILYSLLVKKGMFQAQAAATSTAPASASGENIIIARPGVTRMKPENIVKRVSFSDYPLAAKFMPKHQKSIVQNYDDDDKRQILEGIEANLKNLKGYRSQDGLGDQAMVYAHYFYGQTDYFITETDFDPEAGYENLFGFAILNGDTQFAELGAVGLEELTESRRIELDFYWTPVTLAEAKARAYPNVWGKEKQRIVDRSIQPKDDLDSFMWDANAQRIEIGNQVRIVDLDESPYNGRIGTIKKAHRGYMEVLLDGEKIILDFSTDNLLVIKQISDKFGKKVLIGDHVIVFNYPHYNSVGEVKRIDGSTADVFVYHTGKTETFDENELVSAPAPKYKKGDKAQYAGKVVTILSDAELSDMSFNKASYRYLAIAPEWTDSDYVGENSLFDLKRIIPMIYGRTRMIYLPNGEKHNSQYAIVELDDILASHDEETFSDTPDYPRNQAGNNLNDRNYATDKGAQQLVAEYARDLNPGLLLSLNSSTDGTPIITRGGFVVSGNNRTMSMKLARKKYPKKWAAYQQQLLDDLSIFEFPDGTDYQVAQMDAPVLVRVDYDFGEMTTTNMAKYNASAMKAKSQVDRAAELATTLREQVLCETNIPAILDGYDTLGEFYADRAATKQMVAALKQCSVLNEQDMPGYVDAGLFTEDGKTMLETVLASIVLQPDTVRVANRDGVRSLRQVVVNSLPVLIGNKNLTAEASLVAFINQAVLYQGELVASGLPWADFINQPKLFADQQVAYDPRSIYLNRLMLSGPRKFREALRKYNESQAAAAGATMFANETVSPADAFRGYIIAAVPADEVKLVERYFPMGKDMPEQKQAAKTSSIQVPAKLSELLRYLKPGMKLEIVSHSIAPAMVGQLRTIVKVRSKDIILELPNGKESYLNIPRADKFESEADTFSFDIGDMGSPIKITYRILSDEKEPETIIASPTVNFSPGDKVVSLKDGTQGTVRRLVTSGDDQVLNAYSVTTKDGSEVYWYEDQMAPLAAIDATASDTSSEQLEQKVKSARTALKLLEKALSRLEGARLKTAQTEIKLLTKFLEKNK